MKHKNTLSDLISDKDFTTLQERGLLNKVAVRNYVIQKRYFELVKMYGQSEALLMILPEYPELKPHTLLRYIYKPK